MATPPSTQGRQFPMTINLSEAKTVDKGKNVTPDTTQSGHSNGQQTDDHEKQIHNQLPQQQQQQLQQQQQQQQQPPQQQPSQQQQEQQQQEQQQPSQQQQEQHQQEQQQQQPSQQQQQQQEQQQQQPPQQQPSQQQQEQQQQQPPPQQQQQPSQQQQPPPPQQQQQQQQQPQQQLQEHQGEQSTPSQSTTDNDNDVEQQGALHIEELGIITARPNHPREAVHSARLETFETWPKESPVDPVDLARAGFFYTGCRDSVRCFFCGGGLRNWEAHDDAWVEHAYWFPKCSFLLHKKGSDFIHHVKAMAGDRHLINGSEVSSGMQDSDCPSSHNFNSEMLERDPAVQCVISFGFDKAQILQLAHELQEKGEVIASGKLYRSAIELKIPGDESRNKLRSVSDSGSIAKTKTVKEVKEMIDALHTQNEELRLRMTCKICLQNKLDVIFLPCGHIVSCMECSNAFSKCPVCRVEIKGVVKTFL